MNHKQAFLQAIREAPHDDAPRLIYADWLEEQGGTERTARAAFIRIQCRLAELPEDDPTRDDLEDEAADLLIEHEDEWTQPLHDIAEAWRFSRGFIEHILIGGENLLTRAERLFDFAPLRSLHLLLHHKDVPHLAACKYLQSIESLDFNGCHLNDRALQQLLTSPYLERLAELHLSGNDLNTPGLRALVQAPLFSRLRLLDLSRNLAIGDTAVRLLAQAKPDNNLTVLNLARTNMTLSGLYDLFQSSNLSRLRELNVLRVTDRWGERAFSRTHLTEWALPSQLRSLDLSEIPISRLNLPSLLASLSAGNLLSLSLMSGCVQDSELELLMYSPALTNLTLLNLARNNLGAAGMQALSDSPRLASLTSLDVGHNNIRDTGAKALTGSAHLTRLRELLLAGNGIGGPGLKALVESSRLDQLQTLNLSGNFIGGDTVRMVAESPHLTQLRRLDLSDAYLEEQSARALASSANLARLRTLVLKKNLLGDGGAKSLAQSPHLARLTTLDLNDNRIGKAGAEALAAASWRRMRNLDLRGNVFTDTQEALLRKRFGNAVQL